MKKLIFLAMIILSADVLGAHAAAGAGVAECDRNPDGSIRRAIVIPLGTGTATAAGAVDSGLGAPKGSFPMPPRAAGVGAGAGSLALEPGTYTSRATGAGSAGGSTMPPEEVVAMYHSAPKDKEGNPIFTHEQKARIRGIARALMGPGSTTGKAVDDVGGFISKINDAEIAARFFKDAADTAKPKASSSAVAAEKFTTAAQEFDYFEDVITSAYTGYDPGRGSIKEDQANEIGSNFVIRRGEILKFLLRNADGLKLDNLVAFDMGAVAKGILDRALVRDKKRLQVVDLSGSEVGKRGFDTLFSALVNRGICDQRAKGKDGENWLEGIKVLLPNPGGKGVYPEDELALSKENGITFMPGKSLKLTS